MAYWLYQFGSSHRFYRLLEPSGPGMSLPAKVAGTKNRPKRPVQAGDTVFLWQQDLGPGFIGWATVEKGDIYQFEHASGEQDWRLDVVIEALWLNDPVSRDRLSDFARNNKIGDFTLSRNAFYQLPEPKDNILWLNIPEGYPRPRPPSQGMNVGGIGPGNDAGQDTKARKQAFTTAEENTVDPVSQFAQETADEATVDDDAIEAPRISIDREPKDHEAGLDVHRYALSIASLLRAADGEVCMALFGHWGLGKTFLAKKVQTLLETPSEYKAKLEKHYKGNKTQEAANSGQYEVVWYSAWRYRRVPEQWIFLYETLADQSRRGNWFVRLGRLFRFGIEKNGFLQLLIGLFALWGVLLPFAALKGALYLLISVFGISGLIYLVSVFRKSRGTVDQLIDKYAKLPQHREGLGLQALIGDDITALLKAWQPKELGLLKWVFGILGLGGAALAALNLIANVGAGTTETLPDWYTAIFGDEHGTEQPVSKTLWVWAYGLWLGVSLAVLVLARFVVGKTKKILLVVDDLDRCDPGEVVDLIEGIKVLLEDDAIKERLQVMMLVDERIFRHAVLQKFTSLFNGAATNGGAAVHSEDQIYIEHLEKLFVCWFRLPHLTAEEACDILAGYARGMSAEDVKTGRERSRLEYLQESLRQEMQSPEFTHQAGDHKSGSDLKIEAMKKSGKIRRLEAEIRAIGNTETVFLEEGDLFFESDEADILEAALRSRLEKVGGTDRAVTPRLLRTLLFKYQLARLVYMLLNARVLEGEDRRDLISALVASIFETHMGTRKALRSNTGDRRSVPCIVEQVV